MAVFDCVTSWTRHPVSFRYWCGNEDRLRGVICFSYFEVFHAHRPNKDAAVLPREARPMTARHSAPVLTFTHGDLLLDCPGSWAGQWDLC